MAAGRRLATAVPDDVMTAARCPAFEAPSAWNASDRSSRHTTDAARGWRAAASASGVERLPGAMQKMRTPERTASSISSVAQAALMLGESAADGARASSAWYCEIFRFSSCHSDAASAPRTTPTPAYNESRVTAAESSDEASASCAKALRMATANSAPPAPIAPKGPA